MRKPGGPAGGTKIWARSKTPTSYKKVTRPIGLRPAARPGRPPVQAYGTYQIPQYGKKLVPAIPGMKAKPKAKPKPKVAPKPKVKKNVVPPKRPAASGSSGTAATIPPHATTGAVAPRSLGSPTAAAVARSTPARTGTSASVKKTTTKALTDQELLQQQLAPEYLANDQALAEARRAEAQREALIKSLTTGLQTDLGNVAGQVQGDYDRAFAATTALASAGQQALAAGAPDTTAQQIAQLQAIGAPQEQIDQLKAKNQAIFGGGAATIFGREGVLPGTDLASQGAAASAYARSLPGIAGMQGQDQLTAVIRAAQENEQKIADQRALITAKAPQILQSLQQSRQELQLKVAALNNEAAAAGLKQRVSIAGLTGYDPVTGKPTLAARKAAASVKSASNSLALRYASVFGYDPATGKPTLAAIKAMKADKAKAKKPPSATQTKNWNQYAEDAYHGVPAQRRYDSASGTFLQVPGTHKDAIAYYPALKGLMARGATLAQAQKVLNALYRKGEAGRPYVSLQGRLALERAGMPLRSPTAVPSAKQRTFLQKHGLWSD
jgi:hypothetical protein